jgi:VWFA-related protein
VSPQGRINLDVVVTDEKGTPVSGLELKDFTVRDNNQPQKIVSFHAFDGIVARPDPPVEVILLLDAVNLDFKDLSFARQEVVKFLLQNGGRLAQPVSIFLLTNDGVRGQSRPSTDGNAQAAAVGEIDSGLRTIGRAGGGNGDMERLVLSVNMLSGIAQNQMKIPGRKLLIWVGGWPLLNRATFLTASHEQQQYFDMVGDLSTMLREARIELYSTSLGQTTVDTYLYREFLKGVRSAQQTNPSNLGLKVLATQSGGRVIDPSNDLAAQIDSCVEDAKAFYTLSFDPPRSDRIDEYHDLKVIIDKPGLTARTNTGYYNQP